MARGKRLSPYGRVGIRWTIGNVSERGFRALRLSILSARRLFGPHASYAICLNSAPLDEARARIGDAADLVEWRISAGNVPAFLRERLDASFAEGVAWKFAPLRLFPDRYEISLDNDCIIWRAPDSLRAWLGSRPEAGLCLLAEDMAASFGWFAPICCREPRNSGIRGLPPGFDLGSALKAALLRAPGAPLSGEVDEQGLQVAALCERAPFVVRTDEVSICSPFPGHATSLGSCGAHFVGLNMREPRPQQGCDRAMLDRIAGNFDRFLPQIEEKLHLRV